MWWGKGAGCVPESGVRRKCRAYDEQAATLVDDTVAGQEGHIVSEAVAKDEGYNSLEKG